MKTISALAFLTAVAFATPSHAQLQAASLIGNYPGGSPRVFPMNEANGPS